MNEGVWYRFKRSESVLEFDRLYVCRFGNTATVRSGAWVGSENPPYIMLLPKLNPMRSGSMDHAGLCDCGRPKAHCDEWQCVTTDPGNG